MKIVTNEFLRIITEEPVIALYRDSFGSAAQIEVDKEMKKNAEKHFFELYEAKMDYLKFLFGETNHDKEKQAVLLLATIHYYVTQIDKNKLKKQLKQCQDILDSDTTERNIFLKLELIKETLKLKAAIDTNPVKLMCTSLNNLYKEIYNNMSEPDRFVRISEIMNFFSYFNSPHFYSIDEAEHYIFTKKKTKYKSAKKFIYDKVKKYVIK